MLWRRKPGGRGQRAGVQVEGFVHFVSNRRGRGGTSREGASELRSGHGSQKAAGRGVDWAPHLPAVPQAGPVPAAGRRTGCLSHRRGLCRGKPNQNPQTPVFIRRELRCVRVHRACVCGVLQTCPPTGRPSCPSLPVSGTDPQTLPQEEELLHVHLLQGGRPAGHAVPPL